MPDSLRGKFLLATKALRDDNFFRSVVLIVEHDDHGAMGVIVNHPSRVTVAKALNEHFDIPEHGELVYVGGPVEPQGLFILHDSVELNDDATPVVTGVYVGNSPGVFERVVNVLINDDHDLHYRIFSGCAGWAPGQLEGELSRGDWHVIPANADQVFTAEPYELWDELLQEVYKANRILPQQSEHPEWN